MPFDTDEQRDIARKLLTGSGVRLTSFLLARAAQAAQIIIFARLFEPSDIGTAALVGSCIGIAAVVANFGFTQCVLRTSKCTREFSNTAFSLSLLMSLAVFFAVCLAAPVLSKLLGAELHQYLWFLAIMVCAIPLRFPTVFWEKDLRFGHPSVVLLIPVFVNLIVAMGVELFFRLGVWSLLIGNVTGFLASGLYAWLCASQRPALQLDSAAAKEILRFGTPLMLHGLNSEAMARGDNLMVGAYAGATNLAYYNFAWQLPMLVSHFTSSLDALLLPVYARLMTSREALLRLFNLANKMWAITGSCIGFFIILYADTIIALLYGDRWAPVVPLLRIMTISFIIRFCSGYAYDNLALVRGRTLYIMKWGIVNTVLIFSVGLFLIKTFGPYGGAWFWVVQAIVVTPFVRLPLIYQELKSLSYLKHIWQPVLSGIGAAIAVIVLDRCMHHSPDAVVFGQRVISMLFYGIVYVGLLFVLDRGLVSDIKKIFLLARQQPSPHADPSPLQQ